MGFLFNTRQNQQHCHLELFHHSTLSRCCFLARKSRRHERQAGQGSRACAQLSTCRWESRLSARCASSRARPGTLLVKACFSDQLTQSICDPFQWKQVAERGWFCLPYVPEWVQGAARSKICVIPPGIARICYHMSSPSSLNGPAARRCKMMLASCRQDALLAHWE